MAFTDRALNWKKNLFDNPPRADNDDPQYANIRAKKFLDVHKDPSEAGPGAARYEVQVPTNVSTESQLPQTPIYSQTPIIQPEILDLSLTPPPGPIIPPPNPNQPTKPTFDLNNTPFQQGTVIANQPEEKEIIMEPGASFIFGSDDQQAGKK